MTRSDRWPMPNIARLLGGALSSTSAGRGISMPTVGMVNGARGMRFFNDSWLRSLSDVDLSTAANDVQASALFSAPKKPQRIPANTPPVFRGLRSRICLPLPRLVTNGNIGQAPDAEKVRQLLKRAPGTTRSSGFEVRKTSNFGPRTLARLAFPASLARRPCGDLHWLELSAELTKDLR